MSRAPRRPSSIDLAIRDPLGSANGQLSRPGRRSIPLVGVARRLHRHRYAPSSLLAQRAPQRPSSIELSIRGPLGCSHRATAGTATGRWRGLGGDQWCVYEAGGSCCPEGSNRSPLPWDSSNRYFLAAFRLAGFFLPAFFLAAFLRRAGFFGAAGLFAEAAFRV